MIEGLTFFKRRWDELRTSYWFVPASITVFAVLAAYALVKVDRQLLSDDLTWGFRGEPAGARALLTTVGTAAISIASLTFSVTIVALTLASSQFGSRLLYNFMRDRVNQVVLGTFVATFVYCLLVLRSIQVVDGTGFVPNVAVTTSIGLGLLGIGLLIFFFHHVAESIQANTVVARVGDELMRAIERFFPEPPADEEEGAAATTEEALDWMPDPDDEQPVPARGGGILQAIDVDRLVEIGRETDAVIRIVRRPGQFVLDATPVAHVSPTHAASAVVETRVQEAFAFGRRRTLFQDVRFGIDQLVEVAVRALSPGINDPFTAMSCIDQLGRGLAEIMRREDLVRLHRDEDGAVRVVADPADFASLVGCSFDQIRRYGRADVAVSGHLLHTLGAIAPFARSDAQHAALRNAASLTHELAGAAAHSDTDRAELSARYGRLVESLLERA